MTSWIASRPLESIFKYRQLKDLELHGIHGGYCLMGIAPIYFQDIWQMLPYIGRVYDCRMPAEHALLKTELGDIWTTPNVAGFILDHICTRISESYGMSPINTFCYNFLLKFTSHLAFYGFHVRLQALNCAHERIANTCLLQKEFQYQSVCQSVFTRTVAPSMSPLALAFSAAAADKKPEPVSSPVYDPFDNFFSADTRWDECVSPTIPTLRRYLDREEREALIAATKPVVAEERSERHKIARRQGIELLNLSKWVREFKLTMVVYESVNNCRRLFDEYVNECKHGPIGLMALVIAENWARDKCVAEEAELRKKLVLQTPPGYRNGHLHVPGHPPEAFELHGVDVSKCGSYFFANDVTFDMCSIIASASSNGVSPDVQFFKDSLVSLSHGDWNGRRANGIKMFGLRLGTGRQVTRICELRISRTLERAWGSRRSDAGFFIDTYAPNGFHDGSLRYSHARAGSNF